jgi:hypothetical protein
MADKPPDLLDSVGSSLGASSGQDATGRRTSSPDICCGNCRKKQEMRCFGVLSGNLNQGIRFKAAARIVRLATFLQRGLNSEELDRQVRPLQDRQQLTGLAGKLS